MNIFRRFRERVYRPFVGHDVAVYWIQRYSNKGHPIKLRSRGTVRELCDDDLILYHITGSNPEGHPH